MGVSTADGLGSFDHDGSLSFGSRLDKPSCRSMSSCRSTVCPDTPKRPLRGSSLGGGTARQSYSGRPPPTLREFAFPAPAFAASGSLRLPSFSLRTLRIECDAAQGGERGDAGCPRRQNAANERSRVLAGGSPGRRCTGRLWGQGRLGGRPGASAGIGRFRRAAATGGGPGRCGQSGTVRSGKCPRPGREATFRGCGGRK